MTIEQTQMRLMHAVGGLKHGRGMKDNAISQWINLMPTCTQTCDAIKTYAEVHSFSSYQLNYSPAQDIKDTANVATLYKCFSQQNPFVLKELISLSSREQSSGLSQCLWEGNGCTFEST